MMADFDQTPELPKPRRTAQQRRRQRLGMALGAVVVAGLALALVLTALSESVAYFKSPSELAALALEPNARPIRVGGLVVAGSVKQLGRGEHAFELTDNAATVAVRYRGVLPDLFREGQGIIATGTIQGDGIFVADEVLAKHDEEYMPPEVKRALEKAGHPGDGGYGGSTSNYGGPGTQ